MTSLRTIHRVFAFASVSAALVLFASSSPVARAADPTPIGVDAFLYSTMPSRAAHRPVMAMDGDEGTYYRSVYGMGDGDDFVVLLSHAIPVQSIKVVTGDVDGGDLLTNGFVETTTDGVHFDKAADFDAAGVAAADMKDAPVAGLRIRLNRRRGIPALLIREISIQSPVKIDHVEWGPWHGFSDISASPDLAGWAATAEKEMEEFYPDTCALLYSDKFIPPNTVNVIYRTGPGVTGVAATGGGVMTVNTKWCHEHPEDTGLTVHEMSHVIQAYSAYNPVWLVEGIADYIRWVRFEPENQHAGINTKTATYHDSYRTTATFLGWLELHYDSRLVTKLSQDVRFNRYNKDLWQKYCGKDVDTLWSEFIAAYKLDPAHIILPVIAPADRPRVLPTVTAGTSQPVDLSAAFNGTGITQDGAAFGGNDGFDSGGASFSAKLLGPKVAWKNVEFKLGPAGAPDTVSAAGNVLTLPTGQFSSLWILGSAVEANQMAQVFKVTYTDGTTQDLAQNMSDWFGPQSFPGESRAVKMVYRNMADGTQDPRTFYAYSYGFSLDKTKTVKSLTLPMNPYIRILAITLAN